MTSQFNYIITGSGCAGLSLAVHMIDSGKFTDKRILLVDKGPKNKNDRTWCFWETGAGLFEPVVYRRWKKTWFYGEAFSNCLDIAPYEYKMIRGIDFYEYCLRLVEQQPNFEIRFGDVQDIQSEDGKSWIKMNDTVIEAEYIFNSILFEKPTLKKNDYYLLQHFKGWTIETNDPFFNADEATLMDFRMRQQDGVAFVYVMPLSAQRALVEYTMFSRDVLAAGRYDENLEEYIQQHLHLDKYKITEQEYGVIPMTNYAFPSRRGNIIFIGTAGGQTKASSGYTFRFIQKHSKELVDQLIKKGNPFIAPSAGHRRFHFYDSVLLDILHHQKLPGKTIFTDLFKKNDVTQVFKFLDNETSLPEELKIISSLPTGVFLKAGVERFLGGGGGRQKA